MSAGIRGALLLSILVHLLLLMIAEVGGRLGWWQHRFLQDWLVTSLSGEQAAALAEARAQAEARQREDTPLVFLEVDPSQATAEAPEQATYYGALNSRAANPDPTVDTATPRVDGLQDRVPRTTTVVTPTVVQPAPLQPVEAAPPLVALTPKREAPQPRVRTTDPAETALKPGDLLVARPAPDARSIEGQAGGREEAPAAARPERPRTFAQARPGERTSPIVGEKMKQAGGVKRFGVESSLDARSTTYGAYDAAVIAAIQQRWYGLLDERGYSLDRSGKVVITFRMKHDGSIHNLEVVESEVGELWSVVCQKAIADPSPFGVWPRQMRLELGDYRNVRFTFHYN